MGAWRWVSESGEVRIGADVGKDGTVSGYEELDDTRAGGIRTAAEHAEHAEHAELGVELVLGVEPACAPDKLAQVAEAANEPDKWKPAAPRAHLSPSAHSAHELVARSTPIAPAPSSSPPSSAIVLIRVVWPGSVRSESDPERRPVGQDIDCLSI